MRQAGIAVGLGTDGAASNNDLDMFEAMRQAAFLHKLQTSDPRAMSARVGARDGDDRRRPRARAWTRQIGSLEPGKRADLIVVSMACGAADADVRSALPPRLRHARRRRADDDRQRQGPDARPQGADAERRRCSPRPVVRRQGPGRRQRAAMATMNVLSRMRTDPGAHRELAAEIERDYPAGRRNPPRLRAQGRLHVHGGPRPRDERPRHDGFHGRLELRQGDDVLGRGARAQGPRQQPRRPPRHRRRGHRRHRADADTTCRTSCRRAVAEVDEDGVPAEQAVAAEGRRRRSTTSASRSRITFVVGYGLDYAEKYRNLPYIAVLEQ